MFIIRLSTNVAIWVDEAYIGYDATKGFTCPINTVNSVQSEADYAWKPYTNVDYTSQTDYHLMIRHYNHLPIQKSLAFDGEGLVAHTTEAIANTPIDPKPPNVEGNIPASSLLVSKIDPRLRYMYQNYVYPPSQLSDDESILDLGSNGVACCSTLDGNSWQFVGIVFESFDLVDTVFGNYGPFHLDKPSITYQNSTEQYVMWMTMDNFTDSLKMAAIAYSPFADGPFLFLRSLYPDGNKTQDQIISTDSDGRLILVRSFDYDVEYVKPAQIMQPVWESVKFNNGSVNFRTNYHRAYYAVGYDNYNDIYLQRWRLEDKPWSIQCVNRITGAVREAPPDCVDSDEYKQVLGEGNPPIISRYVDPSDPSNSWWRPTSETSVQAQPWSENYKDGLCGIHLRNDGFDENDPALADFNPINRANCSNIADNPPNIAAQDLLLGPLQISSIRTARFVAFTTLTSDGLDTTGDIQVIEGGLEGYSLSSAMLGLIKGLNIELVSTSLNGSGTTFIPPQIFKSPLSLPENSGKDWSLLFKQYVYTYGDRSQYSLACVVDGICPVNFQNQVIDQT
jgi:hypothetical protein